MVKPIKLTLADQKLPKGIQKVSVVKAGHRSSCHPKTGIKQGLYSVPFWDKPVTIYLPIHSHRPTSQGP